MATGYTAGVQDGTVVEFRDFALGCARAFGALIMMRDDPSGTPIPDEFKPSDYHDGRLADAAAELGRLNRLTPSEVVTGAATAHARAVKEWREREARRAQERARYEAMLAKVEAWDPPTPHHVHMKEFMAEQLRDSIRFDCGEPEGKPAERRPSDWLGEQIQQATDGIAYHTRGAAEECKRAAERTAWVRALKDSLAEPEPVLVGRGERFIDARSR